MWIMDIRFVFKLKIMVLIKGYSLLNYTQFQEILHRKKADCNKTTPEIAVCCGLKDTNTVNNAFKTKGQVIKDSVLSKIMNCLGIDGFVHWNNGMRYYYVKGKT